MLLDITPPDLDSDACTTELETWVYPAALLLERTRRQRSLQRFAETTTLQVLSPILFGIAGDSDSSMGSWLGRFSDHQCALIESLGPFPRDTVVNSLFVKSSRLDRGPPSSSLATTSCLLVPGRH